MSDLEARLAHLERQMQPLRSRWSAPVIDCEPGQDVEAEVQRIEEQARAAGWQPWQGPAVLIVKLPAE